MLKKIKITIFLVSLISFLAGGILVAGAAGEEKVTAIVVFKDRPMLDDINFLKNQGGIIKYTYNIIPGIAMEFPPQAMIRIKDMCGNPKNPATPPICERINSMELDQEVYAFGKPTSTILQSPQILPWGIDRVDAELSWAISKGNGIKIAVVDTGIDYTHPDLGANVKGGVSFVRGTTGYKDDNGHGTHVSGIIAAGNNDIGVVGVAPNASLYAVKVLNKLGFGWTSDIIKGIDWSADHGMQVITMSLGSSADNQALHTAVDNAYYYKGIVVVAAAGNDNGSISYPASYSSVIAVTAIDSNNDKASFSNFGPEAELAAPGVNIYSTYKGGTYVTLNGTSMAAPHVTGTVALLLATQIPPAYDSIGNGRWDPPEIRKKLQDTATDLGAVGHDTYYGYGLVNASKATS